MRTITYFLAGSLVALTPASLCAQNFDMQLMMKWADTQVVAYAITGVYSAETNIAYQDKSGQVGDVTDRITIDFTWNVRKNALVGDAKWKNFPSATANLRNLVKGCPPPRLTGAYEHFDLTAVATSGQERIDLAGTTTFPTVALSDCTGATEKRTVSGKTDKRVVYLPVPDPTILAMPTQTTGGQMKFVVAPDKKSFSIKIDGWTWTYVPTRIS